MRLPLCLLIASCLAAPAFAEDEAPKTDAEKHALAEQLASALEPLLVARAIGAPALYGAEVCRIQHELKLFQDGIDYERRVGKESGVVNLAELHSGGEAVVSIKQELAELMADAKKYKVKPAPCKTPLVIALATCEAPECAILTEKASAINAYASIPKGKHVDNALGHLAMIAEKFPDVSAALEQRVAALLKVLGVAKKP